MADPTLALTFSDFQIRVAEYLGIAYYGVDGQGAAQVPINAHDLDLVNRLVNDGYARFIAENPRWNFLNVPINITFNPTPITGSVTSATPTTITDTNLAGLYADNALASYQLTITHSDTSFEEVIVSANVGASGQLTFTTTMNQTPAVGDQYTMMPNTNAFGQPWRIYMPDDFFGELISPWTYNIGGPRLTVNTVSELTIRELRAGANTSGTVSTCAFRPVNTTAASTGKRWETLFWPSPASNNTLTANYKRFPAKLSNSSDRSVAGFQHDRAVLAAMIAEAERQRGDSLGPREQEYTALLAKAVATDARAYSVRATDFGDRSDDRAPFGRRPLNYFGVDTYGGTRIP